MAIRPQSKKPSPQKRVPQKSGSRAKLQAILDAAASVLRRRGYIDASLAEIAELAGTKAGSLYYYFESKDALVEVVLAAASQRLIDRVKERYASLDPQSPIFDRICATIRQHVESTAEQDDYTSAFIRVFDTLPEEMRANITRSGARNYARLWARLLTEAVEAGLIRDDYDLRILRLFLTGGIAWMDKWYRADGPSSPDDIANTIIRIFFQGAATPNAIAAMSRSGQP